VGKNRQRRVFTSVELMPEEKDKHGGNFVILVNFRSNILHISGYTYLKGKHIKNQQIPNSTTFFSLTFFPLLDPPSPKR